VKPVAVRRVLFAYLRSLRGAVLVIMPAPRSVPDSSLSRSRRVWTKGRAGVAALVLLLLAAGWVVAETAGLYLRVRFAPVRSEPALDRGEEKGVAYLGQSFEVLDRTKDGDWVKVSFKREAPEKKDASPEEVQGWMHATLLALQPSNTESADARLWVRDGIKGPPSESKLPQAAAHAQARRLDLAPVLKMERNYPSAKEVDEFLRAGQLGLYRPDWPSQGGGVTK
jgi:hypothetical protein